MDLSNTVFVLVENADGDAEEETVMRFGPESEPIHGTYEGPNIARGQCLLLEHCEGTIEMVYHAVNTEGELRSGRADVTFPVSGQNDCQMKLEWEWLTGDSSNGVSYWRQT